MHSYRWGALAAMLFATIASGCSPAPGDCSGNGGYVPNACLQACVIPKICDVGMVLNACNECVAEGSDAATTMTVDAGEGQTTSGQQTEPVSGSGDSTGRDAAAFGGHDSGEAAGGGNPEAGRASAAGGGAGSSVTGASGGGGMSGGDAGSAPPAPRCGDGHVDPGETCDGSCATKDSCKSATACLIASFSGAPASCDAHCDLTMVMECKSGDGCCAPGCNYGTDTDCSKSCGDGVVTAPETCEPTSKTQPCPSSCDDGNACTRDSLSGTASQCNVACNHMMITAAANGDGCCPGGANATTDRDCSPTCGNGVVESGETCDGNCPTSCDDGNACTTDTLAGSASACTARCSNQAIATCKSNDGCCAPGCSNSNDNDCAPPSPRCGDGHVDPGEICDGNCPTSCDDGNACTNDVLMGAAATCNVACTHGAITACTDGDACCPAGCTNYNDNNCPAAKCGDGVTDPGETCDGTTSCADVPCSGSTVDKLGHPIGCITITRTGDAAHCNSACAYGPITQCISGDGCCGVGCTHQQDAECS